MSFLSQVAVEAIGAFAGHHLVKAHERLTRKIRARPEAAPGRNPARKTRANPTLTAAARRRLPLSAFAIPEKAPGPGSYPIHDRAHAVAALARAAGKPVAGRVRAAVARRYPTLRRRRKGGR